MYTVFKHYCTLNRPQYSVNITFIGTGRSKNLSDLLYCGGLELNLQYPQAIPVYLLIKYQ